MLPDSNQTAKNERKPHSRLPTNVDIEDGCEGRTRTSRKDNKKHFGNFVRSHSISLLIFVTFGFFVLATFVILLILLLRFNQNRDGRRYEHISRRIESEDFMRFYEQLMQFRISPYMLTDSMMKKLSREQISIARTAGIFPIEAKKSNSSTGFGTQIGSTTNTTKPEIPTMDKIPPPIIGKGVNFSNETFTDEERHYFSHPKHLHWLNPLKKDEPCNIQCDKLDITIPPLVVLSLDGFSREYLDRGLTPSLEEFSRCGARSEFVYPSYPSKTFPNHYTIATGLYPESHGVVDNYVFEPSLSPELQDMKRTKFPQLYSGEPIWSLAVRHHRKMMCLFWPGCSFNITGHNPTYDMPYNRSLPYSSRVDMMVEWLMLPPNKRPSLIMAYFDQPDSVGHFHTTDQQVNLELNYIDSVLSYLFISLHKNGLLDCINLVILSDHGMKWLDKRYYFKDLLPDTNGMVISSGVISRIYMKDSNKTVDWVIDNLIKSDNYKFRIYDRVHMPKRYHYARSVRVGDVVFEGQPGTTFYPTVFDDYQVNSDHGYDYLDESMHAIFFARGPNIKSGVHLPPFQNIEYFNLFIDLLRLPHETPNNGTLGLLDSILNNIDVRMNREENSYENMLFRPLPECISSSEPKKDIKQCIGLTNNTEHCNEKLKFLRQEVDECRNLNQQPQNIFYTKLTNLCVLNFCSVSIATKLTDSVPVPVIVQETLNVDDGSNLHEKSSQLDKSSSLEENKFKCPIAFPMNDLNCNRWAKMIEAEKMNKIVWHSLMANESSGFYGSEGIQFATYDGFLNGPFNYLQNLTKAYVRKYKRLASITGTIYDVNLDGIADNHEITQSKHFEKPTHIFRILIRCDDHWHIDGIHCKTTDATRVLAFILPNQPKDLNKLTPHEYLKVNSARIKDVELLTNLQFFAERTWFPENIAWLWRTNITRSLWGL